MADVTDLRMRLEHADLAKERAESARTFKRKIAIGDEVKVEAPKGELPLIFRIFDIRHTGKGTPTAKQTAEYELSAAERRLLQEFLDQRIKDEEAKAERYEAEALKMSQGV